MELRDYLRILWGRRWLIVLCMAVAAGSALGFSSRMIPEYTATAKVFVGPRAVERDDAASIIQELTASQQYVTSYSEMLRSRPLAEIVVETTDAPITATELVERVDTRILPDTRLIEVRVTDPSPGRAQQYANELVTSFVNDERNIFGGGSAISASVFEQAIRPEIPVKPKPLRNGIIGGLLGVMLGVGLAFVLEQLDTTIRNKEDVEKLLAPIPVIATIPLSPLSRERSIFIETDSNSPQAEAIRILRTNIQFFSAERPVSRVLVTSAFAGDGKTTVATNLAAGMAAVGASVVLIETDLRKPVLTKYFEGPESPGLSDVLAGQASLSQAIRRTRIPNLSIIVAGPTPPNPSELLGSERMAELVNRVSDNVDIVILDTPPALPVTDAAVLGPLTDGVILVVRSGQTNANKALDVTKNFERHDVRVLGVAINGIERDVDGGYYYRYSYGREEQRGNGNRRRGRDEPRRSSSDFDDLVVRNLNTPGRADAARSRPAGGAPAKPPRAPVPRAAGPSRGPAGRATSGNDLAGGHSGHKGASTTPPGAGGPAFRAAHPVANPPPRQPRQAADEARKAAFREKLRSSLGENSGRNEPRP